MFIKRFAIVTMLLAVISFAAFAQDYAITKKSFDMLNLDYPGLKKVKQQVDAGKYDRAAAELLTYYRNRKGVTHPLYNVMAPNEFTGKRVNAATQQLADDILLHKFKPHKSYPAYDYGKDINWQYRPVKDQLVTTFLHRTAFWESLATVYRSGGDEKYAKEWVFQLRDWIKKNPQGAYADDKDYAWKAFVVSFRLNHWSGYFNIFLNSPNFTPAFLMEFLNSYNEQANYVINNYTDVGNHLLYEALHEMYAGGNFPEMKDAATWRKSGIQVLNTEISKQVLPDGMQFELSPSYHTGSIKIFTDALNIAQLAGVAKEFPASYTDLVEKMVLAVGKFSFPDYTFPLYGNSFLTAKEGMIKNYKGWAVAFPDNKVIEYYATDGASGKRPDYVSSSLPNAGFYAFRSGWDNKATVLQIKAGPPAFFHSHPDNGNFDLWVKGRNFTPDAGSYVYANVGGQENAKRDWYRSTKAHQTLTLNNENIENNAQLKTWEPNGDLQILNYTNPSYKNLTHQRSFLFIDKSYFLIIDKASGAGTGNLAIRFTLKEDAVPVVDKNNLSIQTSYADGNNLLIQCFDAGKVSMHPEKSFVSYEYQKETERPAFAFEKEKATAAPETFISILYPFTGAKAPAIKVTALAGNNFTEGKIRLSININGKIKEINQDL